MRLPEGKAARWGLALGLAAVAAAFYILNLRTCLYADDYTYSFSFYLPAWGQRVSDLRGLFLSQLSHYRVMNGRAVVHSLAQLFLMWGKPVFNVLNTAAFLGLGLLICRHGCGGERPLRPAPLFAAFGLLWAMTPAFGQSFLWLVGSCNYLFGILLILLALLPVTRGLDRGFAPMAGWKAALYFVLSLLAGWTNENNSVALICIFLCCLLWLLVTKQKIPAWLWLGLAGSVIGCLLLLLSPGEASRLANSGGFGGLRLWLDRFWDISRHLLDYFGVYLAAMLAVFLWGLWNKRPARGLLKPGIFFLAMLASIYSMILSPQFPARTWSGPVVFFAVTFLALWRWAVPEPGRTGAWRWLTAAVTLAALLFVGYGYIHAAWDLSETRQAVEAREETIAQALAEGRRDVALTPIHGQTKWNCYDQFDDVTDDPGQWPNTAYAMYYGLDSVSKAD